MFKLWVDTIAQLYEASKLEDRFSSIGINDIKRVSTLIWRDEYYFQPVSCISLEPAFFDEDQMMYRGVPVTVLSNRFSGWQFSLQLGGRSPGVTHL